MGMDVVGRRNPDAYFRNNVWWWRPLWIYCCSVAPHICDKVNGHMNDGDGLDEEEAQALADMLEMELLSGATTEYEIEYNFELSKLPRHKCDYCGATGIRRDAVGVEQGMPTRPLDEETQVLLGRTHGWCNACHGEGEVDDMGMHYPFTTENVREFMEFLRESGGFSIY